MKNPELSSILEECISQLQRGADLNEVLAAHPKYTRELRPLLETAAGMKYNQALLVAPPATQAQSRRKFLALAATPAERRSIFHPLRLRLALTMTIIVALICGLLSTGLVSASALPGDTLYPVKLTLEQIQLSVAGGSNQRLMLQEQFDQVRAQEVNQLTGTDRAVTVTFSGIPTQMNGDWLVAGVKLNLSSQDTQLLEKWQSYVVQVTGETQGNTVNVAEVQPQVVSFSGKIEGIQPNYWVIDGVKVIVDDHLVTSGEPSIGRQVTVSAQRRNDGNLVATTIDFQNPDATGQVTIGPTDSESINTPEQEQNQSQGSGTGEDQRGSSTATRVGPTPAPITRNGDSDHSPNLTPVPRDSSHGDGSRTRTPEYSGQHSTPNPPPSRTISPDPEHSENPTQNH